MKRRDFSLAAISAATVITLSLAVQAQGPVAAKKPVAGKDYLVLDKPVPTDVGPGKVEVIEFFWYNCPHCFAFEPQFAAWIKAAPKDVVVKRVPVRFRSDFEAQQRAYYVFEALGMVETMQEKLFKAIHVDHLDLKSRETLAAWAGKNGIPEQKFLETFNSFGVANQANRAAKLQNEYKVQGVPSLGVAGRFYTDGSLAGGMPQALQVVDYLIGEARQGR